MLLYYITDRKAFAGSEAECRKWLLAKIAEAARAGVDTIQLREKDLPPRELESLGGEAVHRLEEFPRTTLLINSRIDIAIAAGAAGVHLPAGDLSASEARGIFAKAGYRKAIIGVSCHITKEIAIAESHGADFAVLAPIFQKVKAEKINAQEISAELQSGIGLETLRAACQREAAASSPMPMLALGGVTLENAAACLNAGAAGIAAIRLFQENNIAEIVQKLKEIEARVVLEPARLDRFQS